MAMRRADYDSSSDVSEQTCVARWGKDWRVLVIGDGETWADGGAATGPPHPSKAVAIAYALRLVERGDYR
jgi:hypothetical protein